MLQRSRDLPEEPQVRSSVEMGELFYLGFRSLFLRNE